MLRSCVDCRCVQRQRQARDRCEDWCSNFFMVIPWRGQTKSKGLQRLTQCCADLPQMVHEFTFDGIDSISILCSQYIRDNVMKALVWLVVAR